MTNMLIALSRITLIIIIAFYTYSSFAALRSDVDEDHARFLYARQSIYIYLMTMIGNATLYITAKSEQIIFMTAPSIVPSSPPATAFM